MILTNSTAAEVGTNVKEGLTWPVDVEITT